MRAGEEGKLLEKQCAIISTFLSAADETETGKESFFFVRLSFICLKYFDL